MFKLIQRKERKSTPPDGTAQNLALGFYGGKGVHHTMGSQEEKLLSRRCGMFECGTPSEDGASSCVCSALLGLCFHQLLDTAVLLQVETSALQADERFFLLAALKDFALQICCATPS